MKMIHRIKENMKHRHSWRYRLCMILSEIYVICNNKYILNMQNAKCSMFSVHAIKTQHK